MAKSKGSSESAAIKHFQKHHMHVSFQGKNRKQVVIKVSHEPRTKSLQKADSCAGCTTESVTVSICPRWPC